MESIEKPNSKISGGLYGLGIKHIGTSASKDLARHFSNWRELSSATKEDFISIDESK